MATLDDILAYVKNSYPNENKWDIILEALEYYKPFYQELEQYEKDIKAYFKNGRHIDNEEWYVKWQKSRDEANPDLHEVSSEDFYKQGIKMLNKF